MSPFACLNIGLVGANPSIGGIDWKIKVNVPTGFAQGTWQLSQLVKPQEEFEAGGSLYHMRKNDRWMLDNVYPYQNTHVTGAAPVAQNDNPNISPEHPTLANATRLRFACDFYTWLMFRPSGVDSKFVPLQKESWGFAVEISRPNTTAQWNDPPTIITAPRKSGWAASTVAPEWTETILNSDQYDWVAS